jgi:TPR repeat protein
MRQILALIIALMLMPAALPALAQDDAQALNEAGKAALTRGDVTTAARIFQQLTDADDPNGMNNLGLLYYTGQGVSQDRALAFTLYKRSADHPDMVKPQASYHTGIAYLLGDVVPRDASAAITYLTRAAEMDFAPAEYELGQLYLSEPGITDPAQALEYFKSAAIHDYPAAAYEAGRMLAIGQGAAADLPWALIHLDIAAQAGIADAYFLLGVLAEWEYRAGGPMDVAVEWYAKAEAAGIEEAAMRRWETEHIGPPTNWQQAEYRLARNDPVGAFPFLVRSCAIGEIYGCYYQALALADGNGVPQDRYTALSMFENLCDETVEFGCGEFARTALFLGGSAGVSRNQAAQRTFQGECGTDNLAADSCYSVALMSWDDRFGLRNEALARQYADLSCQLRSTNNEACQMQRHFQIEDRWRDFSQQDALSKSAEPDFLEGLLYGLVVGAAGQSGTGDAATQYGELARQRENARTQFAIEAMRPGSQHYGACPTVNSPGC